MFNFIWSIGRGIERWWNLDDAGKAYARELMVWYLVGLGRPFTRPAVMPGPAIGVAPGLTIMDPLAGLTMVGNIHFHGDWSGFMLAREEIRDSVRTLFRQLATEVASQQSTQGEFERHLRDGAVTLDRLESMAFTLHGCHDFEISGRYTITRSPSEGSAMVRFADVRFTWNDRGFLHTAGAGLVTLTRDGQRVNDREFMHAGFPYPISIAFNMPASSLWCVFQGRTTHVSGWPMVT